MIPDPTGETVDALEILYRGVRRIADDPKIWLEEEHRTGRMLSWPPAPAAGLDGMLSSMWMLAAEMLAEDFGCPLDASDARFQWVLRVAERAVNAGFADLQEHFHGKRGGAHRLDGKREFTNWLKAIQVEAAVRSGRPRAEAIKTLGFSRAAAYRAMRRR